jgi:hypothetical protein
MNYNSLLKKYICYVCSIIWIILCVKKFNFQVIFKIKNNFLELRMLKIMTILCMFISVSSFSQKTKSDTLVQKKKSKLPLYYPQNVFFWDAQTVVTPSGWGASNNTIFAGVTYVPDQVYAEGASDGSAVIGVGLGNPFRNVGFEYSARMNDISTQGEYSHFLKLHKYLGKGTSLAVGGMHLLPAPTTDGISSFYVALSHALQIRSSVPGSSLLNINIGYGDGRFANKSPRDILEGKGSKGTGVFGSLAYNMFLNHSLIVEWSGINLHVAVNSRPFKRIPFFLKASLVDLTSYSGDGARLMVSGFFTYTIK